MSWFEGSRVAQSHGSCIGSTAAYGRLPSCAVTVGPNVVSNVAVVEAIRDRRGRMQAQALFWNLEKWNPIQAPELDSSAACRLPDLAYVMRELKIF